MYLCHDIISLVVHIMTSSFRFKNAYENSGTNTTPRLSSAIQRLARLSCPGLSRARAAPVYGWWPWTLSVNQGYHISRCYYEEIRAIGVSAYARSGIELFVVKHIAHKLEPDAFAKA
jgi:hypothetical protein